MPRRSDPPRLEKPRGHVDWFDRSALSHRRAPWRRWDGRSVSSGGCPARPFGRVEVPARRAEGGSRQSRAAAQRGARRLAPAFSQHRRHLRHRRIERRRLHRDGVRRGRAAVVARVEGAAGDPRGRGDRTAGDRRPRRGARPRDRAPRRQEREPDAHRARAGQGARLRPGQVRQARGRRGRAPHAAAGHDRGHGRRHRVLHGARAGARPVRSITARISFLSASCSSSWPPAAFPSSAARPPRSSITSCTRFRRRPRAIAASVPPSFDAVVARALEKSPTFRYQSARDMQQDLRHVATELDTVPRGTTSRVAARPCRRLRRDRAFGGGDDVREHHPRAGRRLDRYGHRRNRQLGSQEHSRPDAHRPRARVRCAAQSLVGRASRRVARHRRRPAARRDVGRRRRIPAARRARPHHRELRRRRQRAKSAAR